MNGRSRTALIIEDNAGDVDLLTSVLVRLGLELEIVVATDGDEAQGWIERLGADGSPRLDLVVLDWHVPRRSGAEILADIRCGGATGVPVIVLSSSTAEHDEDTAYRLRASCYLVKPMRIDRYRDTLSRAVAYFLGLRPAEGS